ncbi:hypothetical protein F4781DRAFT_48055 [Annulohypoxylon bovei var. microspora]|nr:hypothetical protein F4781DRAFT_48055 [Annulohypoxylon bovei var. microspora]
MDDIAQDNPDLHSEDPQDLKCIHPLTAVDQSAPREYIRWMYIFDFIDTSDDAVLRAVSSIAQGLEYTLQHYPFLSGKVKVSSVFDAESPVQLRYGDTADSRKVRDEIFKWKVYEDDIGDYEILCDRWMPVSQWKPEDFCVTPLNPDLSKWQPAFTLQANFLKSGGLVLCLAFHHSIADDWSITNFLIKFASNIQRVRVPESDNSSAFLDTSEYHVPDISSYIYPEATMDFGDFPEWKTSDSIPNGIDQYENRPTNYIFTMTAQRALQWTYDIITFLRERQIFQEVRIMDCLVGMIWVEIIRSGDIDAVAPNKVSRLHIDVNARGRLTPPLYPSYFGNMSATGVATLQDSHSVMAADINDGDDDWRSTSFFAYGAVFIRKAIERIDDNYVRHRLTLLNSLSTPTRVQRVSDAAIECCKSGTRLSAVKDGADIDFGIPGAGCDPRDGRPRYIRKPWVSDPYGAITVVPRQQGNEAD